MKIGSFESKPPTPVSTTPAAGKPAAAKAGGAAPAANAAQAANAANAGRAAAADQPIKVPSSDAPVKAPPPVKQAAAEPSAQVALSSAALATNGSSDATFDSAKVERIAQAIRDGKFSVNAEAIADKLIINAEELLGRKLSS